MNIMGNLDCPSLAQFCATNKEYREICQDILFKKKKVMEAQLEKK